MNPESDLVAPEHNADAVTVCVCLWLGVMFVAGALLASLVVRIF